VRIGIGIGVDMMPSGGASVPEPDAILGASILQRVRADWGIASSAGRISQWDDSSGNGLHYSQGNGANQPLYDATGGPNGTPIVRLDSSARFMEASLALPAPGTTPTTIWLVFRQNTWVGVSRIVSDLGGAPNHLIRQDNLTGTPALNQYNGSHSNANSALAINTWCRGEVCFSNSTSDYVKLLSTTQTGDNAGNQTSSGRLLGSVAAAVSAVFDIAELIYINRALTAGEKTQLDAYCTARYGAGLV
jgi:hypothetical protein